MLDLSAPMVIVLIAVPVIALIGAGTRWSLRHPRHERSNDTVMSIALQLAGGALIFLGAFAAVTEWQGEGQRREALLGEFVNAGTIALEVGAVDPDIAPQVHATLEDYATAVLDGELGSEVPPLGHPDARAAEVTLRGLVHDIVVRERGNPIEVASVVDAFDDLERSRQERLSRQQVTLPGPILISLVVVSLVSAVLFGLVPAGSSDLLRWVLSATASVVVIALLSTVVLLASPRTHLDARRQPVEVFLLELEDLR